MSISRPLVKCTGRRMAVQLARVMPNWKTISCRKAVTTWPKPSSTADTLSSSLDVEKLITSEMGKGSGGKAILCMTVSSSKFTYAYKLAPGTCRCCPMCTTGACACTGWSRNAVSSGRSTSRERRVARRETVFRHFSVHDD